MSTPSLSEKVLRETVLAVREHGTITAAAKSLGVPRTTLSHRYRLATDAGFVPSQNLTEFYPPGRKLGKVTVQRNAKGEVVNTWERMIADQERLIDLAEEMASSLSGDLTPAKRIPQSRGRYAKQLMNLIPFGDPHFGMYAWAEEAGEDFDINIAERDLRDAVSYLVESLPRADRCVIANLGDFFHADNLEGQTVRSRNILDMDTRLPKVIRVGVRALRTAIETALRRHKTVEVVNVPGNHDPVLGFVMSILLANTYENNPRVAIRDEATWRFYVTHGSCLLGFAHGDKTKDADLIGLMAAERPEEWGKSKHRYFYRGHHHQTRVMEYTGGIVEQFRTLAPSDSYATSHGYLSGRDMHGLTFHSEAGLVSRQICSVDMLRMQRRGVKC